MDPSMSVSRFSQVCSTIPHAPDRRDHTWKNLWGQAPRTFPRRCFCSRTRRCPALWTPGYSGCMPSAPPPYSRRSHRASAPWYYWKHPHMPYPSWMPVRRWAAAGQRYMPCWQTAPPCSSVHWAHPPGWYMHTAFPSGNPDTLFFWNWWCWLRRRSGRSRGCIQSLQPKLLL